MRPALLCLLGLLAVFAACAPPPAAITPQIVTIHYAFSARPWLAEMYDCADELPGLALQAEERPASFLDPLAADLILRLGAPPRLDTLAYALGEEELVIVVHDDNPVERLTLEQAAGLFGGRIRNWKEVGGLDSAVRVWAFNQGEDVQQALQAALPGGGRITTSARLAQSIEEMAAAVSSDPAAIGFLPAQMAGGRARPVRLEGQDGLRLPALLIVGKEPQGSLRELIACVQSKK